MIRKRDSFNIFTDIATQHRDTRSLIINYIRQSVQAVIIGSPQCYIHQAVLVSSYISELL